MSVADVKKTAQDKMVKSIDTLKADLAKVRTGRAHTGILDHVMVDYYGSPTALPMVANLTLILLAAAVERELPFLAADPRVGVHRLKLVPGANGHMASPRTRLVLRVPRESADAVLALAGRELDLAGHPLAIGAGHVRELLPHGTLYAHFVAADVRDEAAFLASAEGELARIGVRARAISGRWQSIESDALAGCSLMVDQLSPDHSLALLERGLGRHRRLGCGLFVPHKSSAAVGVPA